MHDLSGWSARREPARRAFEGRHVRLEPLDAVRHGPGLYAASTMADAAERFRYLPDLPPQSEESFRPWLKQAEASADPMFFTVIDLASGRIAGRQTLMRIDRANGVIEIGKILWSAIVARRPAATEAFYLFAKYVFDDLSYRRFEWRCNDENEPSKRAALRFGFQFEGVFRQHMVVKGRNRDTAWFSMTDREWPLNRGALERWLAPENFNLRGGQIYSLGQIRAAIKAASDA